MQSRQSAQKSQRKCKQQLKRMFKVPLAVITAASNTSNDIEKAANYKIIIKKVPEEANIACRRRY